MADLLAVEETPDDADAFDEACVAHVLARPFVACDPFVRRFARSERRPESAGKHLCERRYRLRDDGRVVALAWRIHDAER